MYDEGIVFKYVDHMRVKNLRPSTIYDRHRALARLNEWADGRPLLYLSETELKAWQTERARQIEPESLRTDTSHVRQFYRWAQREQFRTDDPTLRLIMPRVYRRLPRPIADRLLFAAMDQADPQTKAILALASFAGLRACEIAPLDWSEVDLSHERQIRVEEGKGGKGRRVPVSGALGDILGQLTEHRGPVIPRLNGDAGPNPPHRISTRANRYLHKMGITETLHQCRHRFATATYRACQDIRAVQELLGHSSPTTTAIYAASSAAVAVDAVERAGILTLV